MATVSTRAGVGRPVVTSHAEIERVAFRLFSESGFAGTTLDDIALAAGIGRRTLLRYYRSKNDIPWGRFDDTLDGFRDILRSFDDHPLHEAVHLAVIEFNRFPPEAMAEHRARMQLILTTPELQAHSVLRYADWRRVIAEYVAERTGSGPDDLLPQTASHVALSLSMAGYGEWLADPAEDLPTVLERALETLHAYLTATR
ncbi:mycofactocin system transcriptional regulator [Flexivirga oryzae]|uniref:Mycofactocin system transcriptional regulator n=1 Tax=Flexivirga oryzae TaxID=1794944 RepID=A0A839N8J0_9MICO|nr:mycofactocin system transcriptional regulator [Flexivirga oryzae]MBB2891525.1 mycofactocin system transcriptional regulator [Flexivirga oryzae]